VHRLLDTITFGKINALLDTTHLILYQCIYQQWVHEMSLDVHVLHLENLTHSLIFQWTPLLHFVSVRRLLLGIEKKETTESFRYRVRTAHVWTQGLTIDDFIDQVDDNDDIKTRIEQHLHTVRCIQGYLTDTLVKKESIEMKLAWVALQLYNIIFPKDCRNYFELVDRDSMYEILRVNRLSPLEEEGITQWPVGLQAV
jgi:hypothetical protein